MIWLSFKRWSSSSGSMFVAERIYRHGHRWTPFVVLRPRYKPNPDTINPDFDIIKIYKDGNEWCALIGPDLSVGYAGFGSTPLDALKSLTKWLGFEEWSSSH